MSKQRFVAGFTLIEMMVAMAILATLLTIVYPRIDGVLQSSKESALKENLAITRRAIDQYQADIGLFPPSLDSLKQARYLRTLPIDPVTDRTDTWKPEFVDQQRDDGAVIKGISDIRSGAPGKGRDGVEYSKW